MKVYCPRHNENHNVSPKNAELLIYYMRRLYIEASYAAPMIVTPISAGPEYTYNRTCILAELEDFQNADLENLDYLNVAYALSDYTTRRRLDGENGAPKRRPRAASK